MLSIITFIVSLILLIKSGGLAIKFSSQIADGLKLSKYVVGFLIVSVISILPETFISISSALKSQPEIGLGTLFGGNVADLTLVFAIVTFFSKKGLKVTSETMKSRWTFLLAMSMPILLGWDGHYSRPDGILIIMAGILFYIWTLKKYGKEKTVSAREFSVKNFIFLLLSMGALLLCSTLVVESSVEIANMLDINPAFVGMFMVALGTTLPELTFSIKAVRNKNDKLALGDILGTVLNDATIVVGILAIISPFEFNPKLIYSTAMFMLLASIVLFFFLNTKRNLSKKEAILLIVFYAAFAITEFFLSQSFG